MTTVKNPDQYIAGRTNDGRAVFFTLRHCNRIVRQFLFTLDPKAIDGESRFDLLKHIDARDVPDQFLPACSRDELAIGRYTEDTEPVDWLINALNAGWEPPANAFGPTEETPF